MTSGHAITPAGRAFTVAALAMLWLAILATDASAQRGKFVPLCGREEGIVQVYDPTDQALFADFAVERDFSHPYGEASRQAWMILAPKISRLGDADAATLKSTVGATSPEVLENLGLLVALPLNATVRQRLAQLRESSTAQSQTPARSPGAR